MHRKNFSWIFFVIFMLSCIHEILLFHFNINVKAFHYKNFSSLFPNFSSIYLCNKWLFYFIVYKTEKDEKSKQDIFVENSIQFKLKIQIKFNLRRKIQFTIFNVDLHPPLILHGNSWSNVNISDQVLLFSHIYMTKNKVGKNGKSFSIIQCLYLRKPITVNKSTCFSTFHLFLFMTFIQYPLRKFP